MPPDTVAARPRASLEWLRSPAALGEAPPSPSVLVCGDVRPPPGGAAVSAHQDVGHVKTSDPFAVIGRVHPSVASAGLAGQVRVRSVPRL